MLRPLAILLMCLLLADCASSRRAAPVSQPPHVALPVVPHPGEPGDVAGLQPAQLRVIFGAPAFVRKDGTIEMWRYDGPACKAFFFLYPFGNSLLVRHVETLPRGRRMAADQTCLDSLRTHPATPVS
ncbi:MAG TPA: hypothetical protein VHX61_03525 [Rhizomicrobium sp.]|nr:hypothetical protein [Rhizomicrobium sp.]